MELLQLLRVLFSLSLASVAFSTCPANHLCDNFGHCNSIDPVYEAYTCDCVDGVTGQLCETNIKECDSNPCPPNWECTDAYNAYSCACQAGFTGPTCSISMVDNPCYPNPCNDQTCTNTTSGYSCQCDDPTLTGPNCETIIVCTASTCKNGGTCLPQWDGANYLCQCPTGYQDRNCETETASSSTPEFIGCWNIDGSSSNANLERYNLGNDLGVTNCQEKAIADGMTNFGMIADIPGKKYCYTGSLGELTKNTNNSASECWSTCPDDGVKPCGKFDFSLNSTYYAVIYSFTYTPPDALDCPSSVCVNGGLCIEEVGGSSCLCPPDYTSADCSVPFDYCDSDPCHDGTCTPKVGGYTCTCPSKVTGDNCEISQACITAPGNTACQNGGTCVPSGSTYTCECFGIWNLVANCSLFNHCYQKPCVNGKCNDTGDNGIGYTCTCDAGWTGVNCDKDIDECDSNPCVYSNTLNCSNLVDLWVCNCDLGFSGLQCETDIDECDSNPCIYGNCTQGDPGYYVCNCYPGYTGYNCETEINECDSTPCAHNSTCIDNVAYYNCSCIPGYTDTYCDIEINECESFPCQYGGTCNDLVNQYVCDCVLGTSGSNCEKNFDECASNPCSSQDKKAKCHDLINGFTCTCSPDWTDELCDLSMDIWEVMKTFEGTPLDISLLKDLLTQSSMIKDMVPFILGLMSKDNQSAISWEYEDLFMEVAYRGLPLNLTESVLKWTEPTLGNCFTYNHENLTTRDKVQQAGRDGGFLAYLRVNQEEYLPWVDTSAMMIFVHNQSEGIFGESVRINAVPGALTSVVITQSAYKRLGGKYGECVNTKSEVKSYYYPGEYSTSGCLRSCYQDALYAKCKCMDPRYPVAAGVTICDLSLRTCVDEFVAATGDPSTWSACYCPLPCQNGQYDLSTSSTQYRNMDDSYCLGWSNKTACEHMYSNDYLKVEVYFDSVLYRVYEEDAAMGFTDLLNALGGLIGLLCGVSVVTLIELGFAIVQIFGVLITGKG